MPNNPATCHLTDAQRRKAYRLAKAQANNTIIARVIGVDESAIRADRKLTRDLQAKRAEGKADILLAQKAMAAEIPVMAIWAGKQHLEQADKQDVVNRNIPVTLVKFSRDEDDEQSGLGAKVG